MYERIPWYKKSSAIQFGVGIPFLILVLQFLWRPIAWIVRKIRKTDLQVTHKTWTNQWMYWTGSLFIISLIIIGIAAAAYPQLTDYGIPWPLKLSFTLNIIAGLLTILAPLAFWTNIRSQQYAISKKIVSSLIVMSIVIVAIAFWNHNLIGYFY